MGGPSGSGPGSSRLSFFPTSRARFSAEGSSRDSSSSPDRTWRSTRSASGSSEMLNSVSVVITTLDPFRRARGRWSRGPSPFPVRGWAHPASGQVSFFAAFIAAWRFR